MERMLFLFGVEKGSYKNIRKLSILLIKVIFPTSSKKFLKAKFERPYHFRRCLCVPWCVSTKVSGRGWLQRGDSMKAVIPAT